MRLAPIVMRLRLSNTRFGNNIGGSAELDIALKNTLKRDVAFVIPLADAPSPNILDPSIQQDLMERFGVVVAIATDDSQKDKLGIRAYDLLHDVRNQLFRSLLGWDIGAETLIEYRGGRILDINGAYLWYQFEFQYKVILLKDPESIGGYIQNDAEIIPEAPEADHISELPEINTIYAQFILAPDAELPVGVEGFEPFLPVSTDIVDMTQIVDFTDDPRAGDFGRGFGTGFEIYDEDRRW